MIIGKSLNCRENYKIVVIYLTSSFIIPTFVTNYTSIKIKILNFEKCNKLFEEIFWKTWSKSSRICNQGSLRFQINKKNAWKTFF